MRVGKNRFRIQIVTFPSSQDAGGGILPINTNGDEFSLEHNEPFGGQGWQVYWETNAGVEKIKDKYKAEAYEVDLEKSLEFIIRARNDKFIDKTMQVWYKNKLYTIHGIVDKDYRGRELHIIAKSKD